MADTPTLEALRKCRDALAFYADPTRYHGPNVPLDLPDAYSDRAGLSAYRLDVIRDGGVIARAALAAADAALSVQAEPAPAWTVNRYCSVAMCLAGDKQHEPDCAHHNITGAPDHG